MDTPEESAHGLLGLAITELHLRQRDRRRADGYEIPSRVYETLQDLARIEATLDVMRGIWNKDNDDYRKSSMHLSKLAWDLKKQLQDYL
jgi:hypothetical protein